MRPLSQMRRASGGSRLFACLAVIGLASPAWSGDKVDLKVRLKQGEKYGVKMTMDQNIIQDLGGQKQNIDQTIGFGFTFETLKVDPQGNMDVKVRYQSVQYKQKSPMGAVDYDSTKGQPATDPMAKSFAGLVGQGFEMTMKPNGEVTDVRGVDEMMNAIIKALELPDGPMKEMVAKQLKEQFGTEALKQNMQNMSGILYPEKPVEVGESWAKQFEVKSGFRMTLDNVWTLKSVQGDKAAIDLRTKIRTNPNEVSDMGGMKMSYDLTGEQEGVTHVDVKTGWTTGGKLTQTIKGTMKLMGAQEMTIPMTIKSNITMEPLK